MPSTAEWPGFDFAPSRPSAGCRSRTATSGGAVADRLGYRTGRAEFAHVLEALVRDDPATYFRPPYVGHRGWIGVRLEADVDWDAVRDVCEDAFRCVAPAALVAEWDDGSDSPLDADG